MKNKIKFFLLSIFILVLVKKCFKHGGFHLNISEIEILNDGIFKGLKRGTATTNEGLEITADEFEYIKFKYTKAKGNVG